MWVNKRFLMWVNKRFNKTHGLKFVQIVDKNLVESHLSE